MGQPIQLVAEYLASLLSDSFALFRERPSVTWVLETPEVGDGAASGDVLWWSQSFTLSGSAELLVGSTADVWTELGARADATHARPSEDIAVVRGRYLDILLQALTGLAQTLSSESGQYIQCVDGREAPSAPVAPLRARYSVRFPDTTVGPLWVEFPSPFLTAIHDLLGSSTGTPSPPVVTAPVEGNPAGKFELLVDVELPVNVSFGKTALAMRDVLKLGVGSIVELNRTPSEPVEIVVNNCVIARGEVVVVEGNYGVRVKEVISRRERLSTLA